jgi:hypothetical protein
MTENMDTSDNYVYKNDLRGDKKKSKCYTIAITEAQAKERQEEEMLTGESSFGIMAKMQDLKQCQFDYEQEVKLEDETRLEITEAEKGLAMFKEALDTKEQNPGALSQDQRDLLKDWTKKSLQQLIAELKVKRSKATRAKNVCWNDQKDHKKEIAEMKKSNGGGVFKGDDNRWYENYRRAPTGAIQPFRRLESEIGRDLILSVGKPEKLQELDYKRTYALLKEYKESTKDPRFARLLIKAIDDLENTKVGMTRQVLADNLKPLLTGENQSYYEQARFVVNSTTEGKYEMSLPADQSDRSKRVAIDGKSPGTLKIKNEIKLLKHQREVDSLRKSNSKPFKNRDFKRPYNKDQRNKDYHRGSRENYSNYNRDNNRENKWGNSSHNSEHRGSQRGSNNNRRGGRGSYQKSRGNFQNHRGNSNNRGRDFKQENRM